MFPAFFHQAKGGPVPPENPEGAKAVELTQKAVRQRAKEAGTLRSDGTHDTAATLGAPTVNAAIFMRADRKVPDAQLVRFARALLAARQNKTKVEMIHIFNSIEKVILGPERKSHILSDKEKKVTAYHEAGHALVARSLPNTDPVHKVSIVSRGSAAGYTLKMPTEDKSMHTRAEFIDELAVLLAGYTTEREIFGDLSTGASNDLKEATRLARRLIMQYGMSDTLGARTFGEREELIFLGREIHEQRDYSEKVAELIDKEISKFIDGAIKTAQEIIAKRRDKLDQIAGILLEKETIERDDFEALFTPAPAKAAA